MSLKDLLPEVRTVTYKEVGFDVRGLTLEDISALLKPYAKEINDLFTGKAILNDVLLNSPEAAAAIIARGLDEDVVDMDDMIAKVRRLPFSVQIKALGEIWDLTVLDEVEFVKTLSHLLRGLVRMADMTLTRAAPIAATMATGKRGSKPQQNTSPRTATAGAR